MTFQGNAWTGINILSSLDKKNGKQFVNMMPPVDRVYLLFCYLILSSFIVSTFQKSNDQSYNHVFFFFGK
jgi:hypothetical protein